MKHANVIRLATILLFALPATYSHSQQNSPKKIKLTVPQPEGTVLLYDQVFMDQTEVTNGQYLAYLSGIKADSSTSHYLKQLPDTTVWNAIGEADSYIEYYFRYSGFARFPLVGVSHDQAISYAHWLSDHVNESYHDTVWTKKGKIWVGYTHRLTYRLPTENEWEMAAGFELIPDEIEQRVQLSKHHSTKRVVADTSLTRWLDQQHIPYNGETMLCGTQVVGQEFRWLSNGRYIDWPNKNAEQSGIASNDGALITHYVRAGIPSALGQYHIYGNVAEMIDKKGIAKGGGFQQLSEEMSPRMQYRYDSPKEWLGFRLICEVATIRVVKQHGRRSHHEEAN